MGSRATRIAAVAFCLLLCMASVSAPIGASTSPSLSSSPAPNAQGSVAADLDEHGDRGFQIGAGNRSAQLQAESPNTLTIVAHSDERVYYNATTNGRFEPGSAADLVEAEQPDTVSNTTAAGSTAEGGVDDFNFTGQLTDLRVRGGPVRVYVNGNRINPAAVPDTTVSSLNTTAILTVPANERQEEAQSQAALDVSASLALENDRLSGRYQRLLLDERFNAIESPALRQTTVSAATRVIERGIERLSTRQQSSIAAYNNGSLTAHEFLRDLAVIDERAGQLSLATDRVVARSQSTPGATVDGQSVSSWAQDRDLELATLQGPVRDQIQEALNGNHTDQGTRATPTGASRAVDEQGGQRQFPTPLPVYVETSNRGVMLATVVDGEYYRELSLSRQRNATGDRLSDVDAIFNRVAELYPWASAHSRTTGLTGSRQSELSGITIGHSHGELTTFLNLSTGRVVAEHQRKTLGSVPTADPVNATRGGVRLSVERTQPTGPLHLSLATPGGEPIDGTVRVDGGPAIQTGTDGEHWTVAPDGRATVVARANNETVRVRLPPQPS